MTEIFSDQSPLPGHDSVSLCSTTRGKIVIAYIKRITDTRFVRNVAVVAFGTAGAQAITMAFAPLITRLYGPENYGIMGTFMAVLAMIAPLAAMGYPIAIVLPEREGQARALIRLSLLISAALSLVSLVALLLAGKQIASLLNMVQLNEYIYLLPPAVFLSACLAVSVQYVVRKKMFAVRAQAAIFQAALVGGLKAGVGMVAPTAAALVAFSALASVFQIGFIATKLKRRGLESQIFERHSGVIEVAISYRDFPFYRAPQNFINAISQGLPVVLLASFSGAAAAGFYSLARTVLMLPVSIMAKSVAEVFYPHITESFYANQKQAPLILKATAGLAAVSVIPFLALFIFGPWLFGFVFGSDWVAAGEYARWLSIMIFFNFINKPAVAAAPVLGLQKGLLVYEVFSTGSKLVALYFGFVVFQDALLAIILFSFFGAGAYMVLIFWIVASATRVDKRRDNA